MVDFHTHILPGIDDGSSSVAISVEMLGMIREQNIQTIVATPHFTPQTEDVSTFLQRRKNAIDLFQPHLDGINIIPAAEVKYCRNISKVEGIERCSIGNLGYILVEMTYHEWTKQIVDDVISIMDNTGLVPILAHVDRYWNNSTEKFFERFMEAGVLMQLNVSSLKGFWERRKYIKLIREGKIHFLGSDCHNVTKRPPCLKTGFDILEKYDLTSVIEANEKMILDSRIEVPAKRIII